MPESSSTATLPARPSLRRGLTAPSWLLVVLGSMSVAGALVLVVAPATGRQVDFDVYRMGAAHVLGQHLYDVFLAKLKLHFTYPPFAALMFWPFTRLSVRVGQLGWLIVNLFALVALCAVSIRAFRPHWSHRRIWATALFVVFPVARLSPVLLTLDYGQVNILIVLLVLLDLTCVITLRSRAVPRGVLLGVAAAIKLTPLIFIPFLLLTRQFRAAGTALGTFLLCSLGTFAIAPHSSELFWSTKVFERGRDLIFISDQNLHSALQRLTGTPPSPVLGGLLTLLFAVGGLAVATWAYRSSSPALGVLVCAVTGLIISPVSWAHHYVWVVPVLAWLVLGLDRPRNGWWWALAVAVLFWVAPIWWVPNPQPASAGPFVLLAGNSFFLAAVAFLILVGALLWSRARATAGSLHPRHGPGEALSDRAGSRSQS
jgi:alpha-1,2-mannosyltransferase